MGFCAGCGSALPANKKFCPMCGAPAPAPQPVQTPPPTQPPTAFQHSAQHPPLAPAPAGGPGGAPSNEFSIQSVVVYLLKRLPLMLFTLIISWAVHTYLLVAVNQGFNPEGTWISSWLNVSGNFMSSAIAWAATSAIVWSFVFSVFRYGPVKAVMSLVGAPIFIFQLLRRAENLGRGAFSLGAGLALFTGLILPLNGVATFSLAVLLAYLGLSPLAQRLTQGLTYLLTDVFKVFTPTSGHLKIVVQTAPLLLAGFGPGIMVAAIFPAYLTFLLSLIAIIVAVLLWFLTLGPGASLRPLGMLVIISLFLALLYALLESFFTTTVLADDCGLEETGNTWNSWWNAPDCDHTDSIARGLGPSTTAAVTTVTPPLFGGPPAPPVPDGPTVNQPPVLKPETLPPATGDVVLAQPPGDLPPEPKSSPESKQPLDTTETAEVTPTGDLPPEPKEPQDEEGESSPSSSPVSSPTASPSASASDSPSASPQASPSASSQSSAASSESPASTSSEASESSSSETAASSSASPERCQLTSLAITAGPPEKGDTSDTTSYVIGVSVTYINKTAGNAMLRCTSTKSGREQATVAENWKNSTALQLYRADFRPGETDTVTCSLDCGGEPLTATWTAPGGPASSSSAAPCRITDLNVGVDKLGKGGEPGTESYRISVRASYVNKTGRNAMLTCEDTTCGRAHSTVAEPDRNSTGMELHRADLKPGQTVTVTCWLDCGEGRAVSAFTVPGGPDVTPSSSAAMELSSPSPHPSGEPTSPEPGSPSPTSGSPDSSPSPGLGSPQSPSPTSGSPASPSPGSGSPKSPSPTSGSPGSPSPTSGSPGSPSPTSGSPGSPSPGSGSPKSPSPTSGSPGSPSPGSGSPKSPSPTSGSPESPSPGSPKSPSPTSPSPTSPSPKSPSPTSPSPTSPSPKSPSPTSPSPKSPSPTSPSPTSPSPSPSASSESRKTQKFRIRIVSAGELSYAIYGGGVFTVQIEEIFAHGAGRKRYYTFAGAGPSLAIKLQWLDKLTKASKGITPGMNILSDWKEFELSVPATVDDFEGGGCIAQMPGIGIGFASVSVGMFLKFYNPKWFEVYLNTSGVGTKSGFGITALSYYQGWWERRD